IGDAPPEPEDHAADDVAALDPVARPGQLRRYEESAALTALQQPQPEAGGGNRGGEEQVEVGRLEEECVADDIGARHAAPRQRHAEHDAYQASCDQPPHVSAFVTNETTIATAKNVAVAARLAGDRADVPLRPLPEVQPPATFEP